MSARVINRIVSHSMRAYYLPLISGLVLAASAFMPWMSVGDHELGGVPTISALWVLGLAAVAVVLAALSVITRKNSRHPLLVVGLAAFALILLSEQWLERTANEQLWAQTQALAIVQGENTSVTLPEPTISLGGYMALSAAGIIALFGMTIVVKRVPNAYAISADDDA